MNVLLENLQSDILNRNVKITILSCFGDIALAIGPAFEPYLGTTMNVLRQASLLTPNPVCWFHVYAEDSAKHNIQLDVELLEYVSLLREGILEAYTGIVAGLKGTEKGTYPALPLYAISQSLHSFHIAALCSKRL